MVLGLVASGCFLVRVTRSEELAAGERQAAALEHEMTVIDDSALQAMLDASVGPLRALVRRRDLAWTFRLVDSREVNAFAVAGGRVYVTRALVENAKRYDQLAGAIGHEIGHVDLRHTARAMEKASGITLIFNPSASLTSKARSRPIPPPSP